MFKSEGELATAIGQDRQFEIEGWICKFDPLGEEKVYSPFVCKQPDTGKWFAMNTRWSKYAIAKEKFPDLDAIRACVINYLSGKKGISDLVVDEILAMGDECFWIEGSDGEQTRGFSPRTEISKCATELFYDFRIEKHGDIFLVGIG